MKKSIISVAFACTLAACVHAGGTGREAWQVVRASDPVTRASTCAVVASDYVGNTRFTQSGAHYPVVENNSTQGILVGVSSAGRFRMPTGDIFWAVDDRPYRELKAADNPGAPSFDEDSRPEATVEAMTAYGKAMSQALTSTSTMASGATALEMLDEMLAGESLLFRSAGTGSQAGLPDYAALAAGQRNEKGELRPIPLDASFRAGLRECSIME